MSNEPSRPANSVHSVDRAISILQVLAYRGPVAVTDLAAELDMHKSTAFRLLATLEARGLVEQTSNRGRYQLGFGVVDLATGVTTKRDLSVMSRPICEELATAVGETVNIAVHDGSTIVSIDQVIGSSSVTTVNWVGQRSPMHATAAGKVFLANMPEHELPAVLAEPFERYTDHTLTDMSELSPQLEMIREVGYGSTMEEYEIGLAAIAAPIRAPGGDVVAAVSISGPAFRINEKTFMDLAQQLLLAAAKISARNGFPKRG